MAAAGLAAAGSAHVLVGREVLGLRRGRGIVAVLVLVGAGLVLELQVRLRVIEVRGAGQRLRIVGRPVVVLGDLLHRGAGQLGVELRLLGLFDQDVGGLVRVGERVVVALLGGGDELLQRIRVGGVLEPGALDGESQLVGVAGHAPVGGDEAVELRAVQLAFHAFPGHVEAAEITLAAGQRLEGVGAGRRGLDVAGAASVLDHLADDRGLLGGAEADEGLAGKVLGRLDVGAGRQRAPTGDRLLRQVEHELQVSALRVERGDVAQRGEAHVGHAVLDAGFSSGLGGRQDLYVDVGILVIAELLSHGQSDVVRVRRPVEHERHGRRGAGVLGIGVAD